MNRIAAMARFTHVLVMKNWISLLYICLPLAAAAQQTAQWSLYALNPFASNPAVAGTENSLVATGAWRKQWNGLHGSPETQQANLHLPIYAMRGGFGHRQTSGLAAWNYQMPVGRSSLFSLGASGGFSQITLDGKAIVTPDGIYPDNASGNHNDPLLTFEREAAGAAVFGAGAFFTNGKLEAGIAAQQLGPSRWKFSQGLSIDSRATYSASAGRIFHLTDELTAKPVFFVKTDLVETQADMTLLLRFRDKLLGGASLRGFSGASRDAAALFCGTKLSERTTVAYSYDVTLSRLSATSRGSHEFLIQYNLGKELGKGRLPAAVNNPRF